MESSIWYIGSSPGGGEWEGSRQRFDASSNRQQAGDTQRNVSDGFSLSGADGRMTWPNIAYQHMMLDTNGMTSSPRRQLTSLK